MSDLKKVQTLTEENRMLRGELRVAREAADITARLVVRQFEKTDRTLRHLQAANAQRQAVLDAATQLSIISTDLSGRITLFNRGASNLLGYHPDEMVNRSVIDRLHIQAELADHYRYLTGAEPGRMDAVTVFAQHVKQQNKTVLEWTYRCKNGRYLPVQLSITPFYNARGVMRGYLFSAMDMSSQKLMKQELMAAMKTAEAANAAKGDFLARMSHEIRTPMNGIIGMAYLMEKTRLDRTQKNYLEKIQSSAGTLLNLINDILDFSKIDAGKLELESITFHLEDVLADLFNTIGLQAEEKGLELMFHIANTIPSRLVGDPLRLGQILINLTANAIKFTPAGDIVISVRPITPSPDTAPGSDAPPASHSSETDAALTPVLLEFSVKDSGIGLEPDQLSGLFEAFSQADGSITRKYGGTGLGLSICSQLVQMMEGQINVESAPGKGTTFTFTAKFQSDETRDITRYRTGLKGRRALVVDDNPSAREMLREMLTTFDLAVDTAGDGKTALDLLKRSADLQHPYDVILLDWIMPGMDGIETAQRIETESGLPRIPAMLMVTANGREEAQAAGRDTAIDAFLTKPVYPSRMFDALSRVLDTHPPKNTYSGSSRSQPTTPDISGLEGLNVLLVEDNPINQEVATGLLQDAGIIVDTAVNGEEAVAMVRRSRFDLVLMDIQMPVMDGLQASRIIRRDMSARDLPIIAMTAHAMSGDREKSLAAEMNGHLTKPVSPDALYKMLKTLAPASGRDDRIHTASAADGQAVDLQSDGLGSSPAPKTGQDPGASLKMDLPELPGIDPASALERLNYKPAMLEKLLRDFQSDYKDLPRTLTTLLKENRLARLRELAHTLKGIAGYMGADHLGRSAADLEICIKETPENPESYAFQASLQLKTETLIQAARTVLSSLDALPPANAPDPPAEKPGSANDNPANPEDLSDEEHKLIETFADLLSKGEFMAEDLLPEIGRLLTRCGRDRELAEIQKLMDDIDYEKAAHIIKEIPFRAASV